MSAQIKASLTKLDQAVNKLESVIDMRMEAAIQEANESKDGQSDLFASMVGSRKSNNDNGIDAKALADKLDSAISKVEKILQEG